MSAEKNVSSGVVILDMVLWIIGIIIHIWSVRVAVLVSGIWAGVITFITPPLAEIYWFFKLGYQEGFFDSTYCLVLMVYIGLYGFVFLLSIIFPWKES